MRILINTLTLAFAISFSAHSELVVSEAISLEEVKGQPGPIVDAMWLPDRDMLLVSWHSSPPKVMFYSGAFNGPLSLTHEQTIQSFAPRLMRYRDGVLAFRYFSSTNKNAELFKLGKRGFSSVRTFEQDIKNIASTSQSNIISTIDYTATADLPFPTPRLKLFNIITKQGTTTVSRMGDAIGVVNAERYVDARPADRGKIAGRVSALAMSRLPRSEQGIAENRALALVHDTASTSTMHIWFFPKLEKDFNAGQGHMVIPLQQRLETIEFSPNTPGLLVGTNKRQGTVTVFTINLAEKELLGQQVLQVPKSTSELQTNIAAQFGINDSIVVSANDSVVLFQRNDAGTYERTGIQPLDFQVDEYTSALDVHQNRFVIVGTKGSVQFGEIRD